MSFGEWSPITPTKCMQQVEKANGNDWAGQKRGKGITLIDVPIFPTESVGSSIKGHDLPKLKLSEIGTTRHVLDLQVLIRGFNSNFLFLSKTKISSIILQSIRCSLLGFNPSFTLKNNARVD